ncbi:hypothetical protein GQ600_17511 [Phytophthora cactorum]|nr:hypothetical protein GQ600_17511 [Phytophthora cactorum]
MKEAASGGDTAETAITNVFSGRPARGFVARVIASLDRCAPLEHQGIVVAKGDTAFTSLWSGHLLVFCASPTPSQCVSTFTTYSLDLNMEGTTYELNVSSCIL